MAASVSTLVVSWKEAAEMNDSVDSEALVMPSSSGSAAGAGARGAPSRAHPLVGIEDLPLVGVLADQVVRVARVLDPHPPQHLPDDRLDVLVVDFHALQAVELPHLVDQALR